MNKSRLVAANLTARQADSILGFTITGLTAVVGPAQATAAICPGDVNIFTTVALNGACIIGSEAVGSSLDILHKNTEIMVCNFGANILTIYPPVGKKINNAAANVPIILAANTSVRLKMVSITDYAQV